MEQSTVEMKYPIADKRPQEVYTTSENTVTLAFNHTYDTCTEKQLPEFKEKVFDKVFNQPNVEAYQSSLQRVQGCKFIVIEFVLPLNGSKLYNLMYMTSLEDRLLISAFNCPANQRREWAAVGKEILCSIQLVSKSKKKGWIRF